MKCHCEEIERLRAEVASLTAEVERLKSPWVEMRGQDRPGVGGQARPPRYVPVKPTPAPEGAACPGCGSTACQWKRLECEEPVP